MNAALQSIASRLPLRFQQELSRARHGWQIRRRTFADLSDPFFAMLEQLVKPGDWAIDVGANVGHYTLRLPALVGPAGRVVAIEPIPDTFELLATNAHRAHARNITLLNAACSSGTSVARMDVPVRGSGLPNYYEARITEDAPLAVLCLPIDALALPERVALLKVDAEGHDFEVLRGAQRLIERDRPAILTEGASAEMIRWLDAHGYRREHADVRCPNRLFLHHQPGSST